MDRRVVFVVIAAAIVAFVPATASAQGEDEPAAKKTRVEWNEAWPKVRWWEYGVTAVGWGTTLTSGYVLPDTPYGWKGINGFDESLRDELRWSSTSARVNAAMVSDAMFYGLAAFPIVVDDLIVTWGVHKKPDVAYQLAMTDLQSLAVAGFLSTVTERTGRERPFVRTCDKPGADPECEAPGKNQSFVSGHTAAAYAGAGLVCVHHAVLPLYGSRPAGIATCAAGMTTATVAAYLRIASDMHYTSDVISAAGFGLFSGMVFPYLVRFGFGSYANRVSISPLGGTAMGLGVNGVLP